MVWIWAEDPIKYLENNQCFMSEEHAIVKEGKSHH